MRNITAESLSKIRSGAKKSASIQKDRKQNRIKEYLETPKLCLNCKEIIPYDKRENEFCSSSCSASYNNKKRSKQKPKCVVCGKDVNDIRSKCCSYTCDQQRKWLQRKKDIERKGEIKYGIVTIRRYLREVHGCKCSICGRSTWCKKSIPLIVDHVDGNANNNSLKNLRLVCGNCDMQLPTFAGRNLGNGRTKRRKFYKENGYS